MNFKVPLYVYTNGGIIYLNYGIVKNGYIYGENIQIINNQSNYKFVGVLVCSNNQNGTIENVFTNVSIDSPFNSINRGNLVCSNYDNATVQNVYSIGVGSNSDLTSGPNVYNKGSKKIYNNYYFADEVFYK